MQGWRDQEDGGAPAYDQLLKDVDEEEEQLQREEQYEASYNFRFEVGCDPCLVLQTMPKVALVISLSMILLHLEICQYCQNTSKASAKGLLICAAGSPSPCHIRAHMSKVLVPS